MNINRTLSPRDNKSGEEDGQKKEGKTKDDNYY